MIPCICINDKNKPNEIPQDKWVTEGEEYHITFIYNMIKQNGILGCTISEISIDELQPYNCYNLSRFGFTVENYGKLLQMMKDCAEFNEIESDELLQIAERELAILN